MTKLALIDGDIITYRVGFTTEDEDIAIATWRTNDMIDHILNYTKADEYMIFLTKEADPDAFRKKVYPEYKAHRKQPKPKHYHDIRSFMEIEWNATVVSVFEADDALGMEQTPDSVICSIDKDLLQVQGRHFNFVKNEFCTVSPTSGLKHFYTQLVTGDTADNIKGIPGRGIKFAEKLLSGAEEEQEMFDLVREHYGCDEEMQMNGRVLWIWKKPDDDWINHWRVLANEDETS